MEAVTARMPWLAMVCLGLSLGCGRSEIPDISDELFSTLAQAATAVRSGGIAPSCNGGEAAVPPDTALILGTNLCLSCAAVGPLLRTRLREGRKDALVVALEDAPHICRFLQAEKAPVAVYGIAGPEFAQATWLPRVVMADLQSGGWRTVAVSEQDVGSLEPQSGR